MTMRRPELLFLLLLPASCGAAATTSLHLRGDLADASVTIDDQDVGTLRHVAKHGVALPPGQHRLTVEKQGYFSFDRLVEAKGQPITVDVKLDPVPD